MPWGLVILVVLSFVAYWRARDAGRKPFSCVLVLWVATIGGMILGSLPGYVLVSGGVPFAVLPLMSIAGGLVGAGWALREAGRPLPNKPG